MPNRTHRKLTLRAASLDAAARTVDAVLATEQPVTVFDPASFRTIREILVIDGNTFPTQVPLLDSHDNSSVECMLGSTRNIRVEGSELIGTRHLSGTEHGLDALQKIAEGHLTDGSIGYVVHGYADIQPGKTEQINGRTWTNDGTDVLRVSYAWQLFEDSLCPIGADPAAKMRENPEASALRERQETRTANPTARKRTMDTSEFREWLAARGLAFDSMTDEQRTALRADFDAAAPAPVSTEKPEEMRSALHLDLVMTARSHGVELVRADLAKVATREAGLALILERKAVAQAEPVAQVRVTADADDKRNAAAEDGLLHAIGGAKKDSKDLGMRRRSPLAVLREFAGAHSLNAGELADLACRQNLGRLQVRGANQVAASFSNVLANVADKMVLSGYNSVQTTHPLWTRERPVNDFKSFTDSVIVGGLLKKQAVPGEPADEVNLSELSMTSQLSLFQRTLKLTYQMWRNDDLGEFARWLSEVGAMAAVTEDRECYSTLLGATWTGYVTTSAAVYDDTNNIYTDGLDAVLGALQNRLITVNGEQVPTYALADILLAPNTRRGVIDVVAGNQTPNGIGFQAVRPGQLQVISSPWLSASSLTGYSADDYYAIDSRRSPVVAVRDSFAPTPVVREIDGGSSPDKSWHVQHNFAAALAPLYGAQKGDWS